MGVRRKRLRWLAPFAALAVVASVVGVNRVLEPPAEAVGALPPADAAGVLTRVLERNDVSWSGLMTTHVDLGLPEQLSALIGTQAAGSLGGASDTAATSTGAPFAATPAGVLAAVLTTDSRSRLWVDGDDYLRAQVLLPLGELDVVHDGFQWWTFSARDNHAVRIIDGSRTSQDDSGSAARSRLPLSPQGIAEALLAVVKDDSDLTLATPQAVNGRGAYTLRLTPRSTATVVDRVDIAVDAASGLVLRVEVFTLHSSTAVLDVRLSELDLSRPDPQRFLFAPAAGTAVTTWSTGPSAGSPATPASGSVWDEVARLDAGPDGAPMLLWHGVSWSRLAELGAAVDGGRILHSRLGSVLVTDDGRVYAGAVRDAALLATAAADDAAADRAALAQEDASASDGRS